MEGAPHQYAPVPTETPDDNNLASSSSGDAQVRTSRLGAAKLCRTLRLDHIINVETTSVYGSAIVLPQLARSAGWPFNLAMNACRSYIYLLLNVTVQYTFLYMITKQEEVMDAYAGHMYLCDMGATVAGCPDGPGCTGPGGTIYTPVRMYPFSQWSTRNFARDSLRMIFPELHDRIDQFMDPGEYGIESYGCRLLCCFIYMISLTSEFFTIVNIVKLFYNVPTKAEMWFEYDPATQTEVKVRIAGMPFHWKVVNVVFVVVPEVMLWYLTSRAGVHFLLDTSGIVDVIANSVALGFILSVDELLFQNLTSQDTKDIMQMVQGFDVHCADDGGAESTLSEEEILEADLQQKMNRFSFMGMLPFKLLFVVFWTLVFVWDYYRLHCNKTSDGVWLPNALYLPKSMTYSALSFLLPSIFPTEYSDEVVWAMPTVSDTS